VVFGKWREGWFCFAPAWNCAILGIPIDLFKI
jgi:hypothetical protein